MSNVSKITAQQIECLCCIPPYSDMHSAVEQAVEQAVERAVEKAVEQARVASHSRSGTVLDRRLTKVMAVTWAFCVRV